VRITVSGAYVIGTADTIGGKTSTPVYYTATSGKLAVTAGASTTVTRNGHKLAAHKLSHKPPVTTATITGKGSHVTVRFHATGAAPILDTVALLGTRALTIRHGTVKLTRKQLRKLTFYSVDAEGNTERPHGLTAHQLKR
jgi:hypothetical protein